MLCWQLGLTKAKNCSSLGSKFIQVTRRFPLKWRGANSLSDFASVSHPTRAKDKLSNVPVSTSRIPSLVTASFMLQCQESVHQKHCQSSSLPTKIIQRKQTTQEMLFILKSSVNYECKLLVQMQGSLNKTYLCF